MLQRIISWIRPGYEEEMVDNERFLIVGLGNPGAEYKKNRHNLGFMAVDKLAEAHAIGLSRTQSRAIIGSGQIGGQAVILAKPQTYVNRSGDSVGPLADFYRIPPENVLVIYDELDLPFGALRLRPEGGSGGHNGMKSIISHLGNGFPRLRLGIGRPPGQMEAADFVLKDFRSTEVEAADLLLSEGVAAVETFLDEGIYLAMTRHNSDSKE